MEETDRDDHVAVDGEPIASSVIEEPPAVAVETVVPGAGTQVDGVEIAPPEEAVLPPWSPGWGYKDLFYVVAFALAALVVSIIACFAFFFGLDMLFGWKFDLQEPAGEAVMLITMQMVWWALVIAFVYVLATVKHRMEFGPSVGWIPLTRPLRSGAIYCGIGFLLACSVALIASVIPMPTERPPIERLFRDPGALVLVAIFGTTVVPAVEELLFRGFFFSAFETMHGTLTAVIATSVVFSVIHGPQYGWHWQNLVLLFYVGSVFAVFRARTGSVVPAAYIHAGYNGTLLLGVLFAGEAIEKV